MLSRNNKDTLESIMTNNRNMREALHTNYNNLEYLLLHMYRDSVRFELKNIPVNEAITDFNEKLYGLPERTDTNKFITEKLNNLKDGIQPGTLLF